MKQTVLIGKTDYTVLVKIRDTAGAPATGLDETDIDIAYARVETDNDVTTTDVTPASLSALTDAHTDWGFEEVSATDHPGLYRLDIADAVFASGAWSAVVTITGTGLDPADLEFLLVAYNPHDGVRLGLTALPNAAADAAGGLPISDAGGLDLDAQRSDVAAILVDTAEIGAAGAGLTEAGGTGDHLTAVPWNAAWDAEVQSEATDALNAYDPPTRAEATSDKDEILAAEAVTASYVDTEVGGITTAVVGTVDGYTLKQHAAITSAAVAGKNSGNATGSPVFRSLNDAANRVSTTIDGNNDRTASTINAP